MKKILSTLALAAFVCCAGSVSAQKKAAAKGFDIANPATTTMSKKEAKAFGKQGKDQLKGSFDFGGEAISWVANYNKADKKITNISLSGAASQNGDFWPKQARALDAAAFSAMEQCFTKDDAANCAPCVGATLQGKIR